MQKVGEMRSKIRTFLSHFFLKKVLLFYKNIIVIEYNGAILNQEMWEAQIVKDGDNLEIVTIVGGGSY